MQKIYAIEKTSPVEEISVGEIADVLTRDDTFVWVDLQSNDAADLEECARIFQLDPDSISDCFEGEQRPRVDDYDAYHLLFLYGMLGQVDSDEFDPHKLVVFVGPRFLITVHESPIRTLQQLRSKAQRRPKLFPRDSVWHLLYALIDQIVDNYVVFMQACEERVDQLEDQSLAPDCEPEILQQSAALRAMLSEIRHLVHAEDQLISMTIVELADFLDDDIVFDFRHVRDHLIAVGELSDRLRDRLNTVRDNYSFILANRTNEIMKILTIFASIMLPLSLIAGVFGMNLHFGPLEREPYGLWMVIGIMLVIGAGLFAFFRRKHWL